MARAMIVAGFLFCAVSGQAQSPPLGGSSSPTNVPLDSWSFRDSINWTSDLGYAPLSFTNLAFSYLGDGSSLVVDTNIPAWLKCNVYESNGTTNLTVDAGSVTFWFAPNWSSTSQGGNGPGDWAQLIDVGEWTTNASYGYWGLSVDPPGENLWFVSQDGMGNTYTLSTPVSWMTNYFHFIALTYCATNTALYLDGVLATNGPGVTIYPGPDMLTNGFYIGGDNMGNYQSHGLFNTVQTYSYPLSSDDIQTVFNWYYGLYIISPWNAMMDIVYEASSPTTNDLWLQFGGYGGGNASMYINVPLSTVGTNYMFDVYATTNLSLNVPGLNATNWMYVTRAAPGQTSLILPTFPGAAACLYRLGTMLDSDGDGLPDAYEMLVSHTNPNSPDTDGDGISDGDEISPSGLPWRLELARKWAAIIYANGPTATQGGGCGQCTVYLPTPAAAGGATVQYSLSGSAILNSDYTVSPIAGQLTIPAGNSSGVINACASGGSTYSPIKLYADLTLTNAPGCRVDNTPAEVNIVDTGLPGIRVYALPQWTHRPCATYGTNASGFYFIRGGPATNALTASLGFGGTAVSGVDYIALPSSVSFSAGVRTNWLPLTIIPNSTNVADKTLTVTINSAPGYQIDPTNGAATMTIAATASPVLPVVQVTATVPDATITTPGQFTFTRSFVTANTLRVFYNTWGAADTVVSSTNGVDSPLYRGLPGFVDIPANVTNVNVALVVSNSMSTTQPIIVTLAQGEYTIGANNMDTVYVDGAGPSNIVANVTRDGIYGASVSAPAEIQFTRYGSALAPLSVRWTMTNGYIGPVLQNPRSGTINWAVRQSVTNVQISTAWNSWPDTWVLPTMTWSDSYGQHNITVPYNPPSAMF